MQGNLIGNCNPLLAIVSATERERQTKSNHLTGIKEGGPESLWPSNTTHNFWKESCEQAILATWHIVDLFPLLGVTLQ